MSNKNLSHYRFFTTGPSRVGRPERAYQIFNERLPTLSVACPPSKIGRPIPSLTKHSKGDARPASALATRAARSG